MIATVKTLHEIRLQPAVWRECLLLLKRANLGKLVEERLPEQAQWLFVGCGTSYYLAQAAAASFTALTSHRALALPASELLLYPEISLQGSGVVFPVLISRSGHTSEILAVADMLNAKDIKFMALTCDGNELAASTDRVLQLPVHEESTVMTSSFTSMLLAMQFLAATLAGDGVFLQSLEEIPGVVQELLERYDPLLERFAERPFEDFIALGQGPLYPIASEVALKVMESSSTYAQFFHSLEFRHGPKSIIQSRALVVGLIADSTAVEETKVLVEMKELGARTLAIVNHATPAVTASADLVIELDSSLPELALLIAYVVSGQLFGSYAGLAKGLNPDEPTNLTRVVTF